MRPISLFGLSILTLFASCSQTDELQDTTGDVKRIAVECDDFVDGDLLSRMDIGLNGSTPSFTFAATDTLGIFPEKGDQVSFPLSGDVGKSSTTFDGGGWQLKNGITYYAYLPFSRRNFATDQEKNRLLVKYTGQKQSQRDSRAEIGNYVYMTTEGVSSVNNSLFFQLHHVGALARLGVTIPAATIYSKLYLLAENDVFITEGTVDLESNSIALTPIKRSDRIMLSLNNQKFGSSDVGTSVNFFMMVPPFDCTGQTISVVLVDTYGNTYVSDDTRTGKSKTFVAGNYYGFTASTFTKVASSSDDGGDIGFLLESESMGTNNINVNF